MVELTIVSGFLGAGKTTLLRQLILQSLSRGERCVVIENEFGSVGLDAALLARTGVPVHELNQGCVCCTLKSSFVETLRRILIDESPDRIFFEPSGIFIPDSFLEMVQTPEFFQRCRVASFVTVVDAKLFSACRRKFGTFFRRQAEFADVLAISKTEGQGIGSVDDLQAELREVNPRAIQLLVARQGVSAVDLDLMLDSRARSAETLSRELPSASESSASNANHPRFHLTSPDGHGFEMLSGQLPASMGITELEELLKGLTSGRYGNVIRAKGQLWKDVGWVEFSLVAGLIEIAELRLAGREELPATSGSHGQIVVIGEALDKAGIRERLRYSIANPSGQD